MDVRTTYIKFFAAVDGNSTNLLMNAIEAKLREGVQKFVLLISTPGGSVFHGLSIHNYLTGIPAEVDTHNFGSIDSIGAVLFVAGRRRLSVPDGRFVLHPVSMQFQQGAAFEEEQLAERLKGIQIDTDNIAGILARATGKPKTALIQAMRDRTTLSPEEAKTYGLVHEITPDLFPLGADLIAINLS